MLQGGPVQDGPALNRAHATPLTASISPQVPQLSQDMALNICMTA